MPDLTVAPRATEERTPGREDWVLCRGCGWEGSEADTIWTDNNLEECEGENPEAALSCERCHSSDLADHPDSLEYPDEYRNYDHR